MKLLRFFTPSYALCHEFGPYGSFRNDQLVVVSQVLKISNKTIGVRARIHERMQPPAKMTHVSRVCKWFCTVSILMELCTWFRSRFRKVSETCDMLNFSVTSESFKSQNLYWFDSSPCVLRQHFDYNAAHQAKQRTQTWTCPSWYDCALCPIPIWTPPPRCGEIPLLS